MEVAINSGQALFILFRKFIFFDKIVLDKVHKFFINRIKIDFFIS